MEIETKQTIIVGIRFSPIGKNYYFDASKLEDLKVGDNLIVETSRGWQLGILTRFVDPEQLDKNSHYKPVDRVATEADLKKKNYLEKRSEEALGYTQKRISIKEIKDVKMVSAEFSFDEKTLTFLYSTENDNHINFNSTIKEIKNEFNIKKVDFHKIGPRDVAKHLCGMGACGLENRCCSQHLEKFESISIRMAKTQGISLTPSDITGMCNRLRCCLGYEYCTYVDALKEMPKLKKKVQTPYGEGVVKDLAPLSKTVFVSIPEHGIKELALDEITELNTQLSNPAKSPENNPEVKKASKNQRRFNNRRRRPNKKNNQDKK